MWLEIYHQDIVAFVNIYPRKFNNIYYFFELCVCIWKEREKCIIGRGHQ